MEEVVHKENTSSFSVPQLRGRHLLVGKLALLNGPIYAKLFNHAHHLPGTVSLSLVG